MPRAGSAFHPRVPVVSTSQEATCSSFGLDPLLTTRAGVLGLGSEKGCALAPPQTVVALPDHRTKRKQMLCPWGTREGKVPPSTLPPPRESQGRAGLSFLEPPVIRWAGEGARGGSPGTGPTGCWGETGSGKGLRGRRSRLLWRIRGPKSPTPFL